MPLEPKIYQNSIKIALQYKGMMDAGKADSKADLARQLGVSRAKITQMLDLLNLNPDVLELMLGLDGKDERLGILTDRRLRRILKLPTTDQKGVCLQILHGFSQ